MVNFSVFSFEPQMGVRFLNPNPRGKLGKPEGSHRVAKQTLTVRSMCLLENHDHPIAEADLPGAFFSVTSNVDEHFRKAGLPTGWLWELHGNTETWQCSNICTDDTWRAS